MSLYAEWLLPLLLVCVGSSYFAASGSLVFMASWCFLYAIGYLYVNLKKTRKIYTIGLVLLELLLIIIVGFKFDVISHYFNPLNRIFHDVSGVFVVIIGIQLLTRLDLKRIPRFVDVFDKYSFHVFLIHYFFVVGPFSLAHLTPYVSINVLSIVLVTFVTTFLFVKLNDLANRLVLDKIFDVT